jgi:hypothetical protein
MNWHLANPALLLGLAGIAIPIVIHLLNRRRAPVVDWGAMQFLELGRRARRKFQLTELLLMMGRMLLLALVALAVAKPFWTEDQASAADGSAGGRATSGNVRRDVVLILDGSDSMQRRVGNSTPSDLARSWAREFVGRLPLGSSVAVLVAKDRVARLVDPPSFDLANVGAVIKDAAPSRGSSDFPAAIVEAFGILAKTQNPAREVVILTDGQKLPWRANESNRWSLLRDLHRDLKRRLGVDLELWSLPFGAGTKPVGADGSVAPLQLVRGLVPPNSSITIRTAVANAGPAALTRTAELLVDGHAMTGNAQVVGPISAGSQTPLSFKTTISEAGSHLLTVHLLSGDDPLPTNDEASRPIEVTEALSVLLVDGEMGLEPLSNETDFLRSALAPTGDDTPQVRAKVVPVGQFTSSALMGQRVVVLANIERLDPSQGTAVATFLGAGGGVLFAPGDRTDADSVNSQLFQGGAGWLPAKLSEWRGDSSRRDLSAHPAPPSFTGSLMTPFGQGDAPALGEADFFFYRVLTPTRREPAAVVLARFDSGDPWIVERPYRKGRVAILAAPIDAEGGTLPVNPDFVPWAHELVFHLADPGMTSHLFDPGAPVVVDLEVVPPLDLSTLSVRTPAGTTRRAKIDRTGSRTRVVLEDATEPGIYRISLPEPPGGYSYASVTSDARESDLAPLLETDAKRLAEGWPLAFESDPARLSTRLLASRRNVQHSIWRGLVLVALAGLCLEIWLTRRLARDRGIADV